MWLVCLASFFMLIAANGMVQLYGDVAYPSQSSLDSTQDVHYAKQKVAYGLGSATLIIIAIKILDKVYYRERLLSTQVYNWLDGFYKQAEEQRMASAALQRDTLGGGEERPPPDMRTSVVSAASQGFNDRASFRVVAKVLLHDLFSPHETGPLICLSFFVFIHVFTGGISCGHSQDQAHHTCQGAGRAGHVLFVEAGDRH
jgi:hypothetical protein